MGKAVSHRILEILLDLLKMSAALLIVAASVYFFLIPSGASVSSISGLAIILQHFTGRSISELTMLLNIALLLLGFLTCGREFGAKTVYASILLPLFLGFFERLFPAQGSLTGDQTLDVVSYIFTVSIGLCILFNDNASSGGLDIVAKIMNRYLHMEIGAAMSLAGMCIALSSALVSDKKTLVLSILGTYFNGIILDHFIFGQTMKKKVCIISKEQERVRSFILRELHSGATVYDIIGAYQLEKRQELVTIVNRQEFQRLMRFLREIDKEAFITVYQVTEMHYIPKGPLYPPPEERIPVPSSGAEGEKDPG